MVANFIQPIKMIGMSKIIPFNLTEPEALALLRDCARDESKLFISQHARERMQERHITRKQVLACMEKGRISEGPYRDIKGDWKCNVEHYTAGNVITAAVAIKYNENGERIVIVTVF